MTTRMIEPCGSEWSAWLNNEFIGVFETVDDAVNALYDWDRKLWPWKFLWEVEQEADYEINCEKA